MIPSNISRRHLLRAIARLDRDGHEDRFKSTKYDLVHRGRRYPPKQVVRIAGELAAAPIDVFYGGRETNDFLRSKGFVVLAKNGSVPAMQPQEEDDELAFPEGGYAFKQHRVRERSAEVAKLAKERRLRDVGELRCDVCDFSFGDVYGEDGAGFIEAHHNVPLSEATIAVQTKPSDLALVCSNCHRMLHRSRPWSTVSQLRERVTRARNSGRLDNRALQRTGFARR